MDLMKVLPEEIWDKIFNYLSKEEFLELFVVSKEMYEYLGYSRYFRRKFYFRVLGAWFDESDETMTAVLEMKRSFSKLMLSNPQPYMKKIMSARKKFENIEEFEFSCPFGVKSPDILFFLNLYRNSIKKLKLSFFGSCFIDYRLLGYFSKLRHLESETTSASSTYAIVKRAGKLESINFMTFTTNIMFSKKKDFKKYVENEKLKNVLK